MVLFTVLPVGVVSHAEAGMSRPAAAIRRSPVEPAAEAQVHHHHLDLGAAVRAVLDRGALPLALAGHAAGAPAERRCATSTAAAPPFSAWEREIAARYLRARRDEGGVALISIISFVGITLAVAVLIIVMSVMNGFRADLSRIMLSFEPNARIYGGAIADASLPTALERVRAIPGVVEAYPAIEQ